MLVFRRSSAVERLPVKEMVAGSIPAAGASQYEAQNSARAKREQEWREWWNPKNSKGFPTIFSEKIAEPFSRGGGSMFSEHSKQKFCEPIFFLSY